MLTHTRGEPPTYEFASELVVLARGRRVRLVHDAVALVREPAFLVTTVRFRCPILTTERFEMTRTGLRRHFRTLSYCVRLDARLRHALKHLTLNSENGKCRPGAAADCASHTSAFMKCPAPRTGEDAIHVSFSGTTVRFRSDSDF